MSHIYDDSVPIIGISGNPNLLTLRPDVINSQHDGVILIKNSTTNADSSNKTDLSENIVWPKMLDALTSLTMEENVAVDAGMRQETDIIPFCIVLNCGDLTVAENISKICLEGYPRVKPSLILLTDTGLESSIAVQYRPSSFTKKLLKSK